MKGLAAIGVAGLIAMAGALWFSTNPTVVVAKIAPVQPNTALPVFKPVPTKLSGGL
jgi:hypothetical protein